MDPRQVASDMSASSSGSSRPGTRSSLASSATRDSVTSSSLDDGASTLSPTNSHALAEQSIRDAASTGKGACQLDDAAPGVRDMGWNGTPVPRPVVGGLANDDLFTMTRRFDKQIFHVHSVPAEVAAPRPLSGLDLDMADGDEFSPDKMRAHLERLYMGVLMGLFAGWKHVVRLRSWRESRRTGSFLAVYAAAWLLDALFPVAVAFLMVLILHPPARPVCFPPAPPALIDPRTGGVQKPAAGLLASDDSATGAPEKHKGEAVEQEAHSFVTSMASVCSGVSAVTFLYSHALTR